VEIAEKIKLLYQYYNWIE